MKIQYQDLINDYYENLNTNLRNFRGGPGFLESWVHDEDHTRSLLGIFDLANENKIDEVQILLSPDVMSSVNFSFLSNEISPSSLKQETKDQQVVLTFSRASGANKSHTTVGAINEAFKKQADAALQKIQFEGELPQDQNTYRAEANGVRLQVAVDDKGIVQKVRHFGANGYVKAILDVLAAQLLNRPFQEGSEHGLIRVMHALRDYQIPLHVKGLVTPENADQSFHLPMQLLRSAFKNFQEKHPNIKNEWRDAIAQNWLSMPIPERIQAAQKEMISTAQKMGLQTTGVEIVQIKNDTRLVLSLKQDINFPSFGNKLIQIERALRAKFGAELEFQVEGIEDRNKRVERSGRTNEVKASEMKA